MTTSIASVLGILVIVIIALAYRSHRVGKFQKNVQMGDWCWFYYGENKIMGEIIAVDNVSVVISSEFGTSKRFKSDIYPLW